MDRMLGVWTRKFARVAEPVGEEIERASSSKRKSTVSEMFIEKTRTALGELIARRLEDMRLAVMMLDRAGTRSSAGCMSSRWVSRPRA